MQLSAAAIDQVWDGVAACAPARSAALAHLESALESADAARRAEVERALVDLGGDLRGAAHLDEGRIQRLLEEEALELNQALLDDRWACDWGEGFWGAWL